MYSMCVLWNNNKKKMYKKQQGAETKFINETHYHTIPKIPCKPSMYSISPTKYMYEPPKVVMQEKKHPLKHPFKHTCKPPWSLYLENYPQTQSKRKQKW